VLYASFDTSLQADLGGGTPLPFGPVSIAPNGRFGGAAAFRPDAAVADGGAAMYFVRPEGGAPVFPDEEGTLSMWVRTPISGSDPLMAPVFHRAVGNVPPTPVEPTGLTLVALRTQFGLVHTPAGAQVVLLHTFPPAEVKPYLRDDYNQLVTAWRRGDTPGPTAYLAINGGLGERFDDAGPNATDPYADTQVDDAGALRVPYRGFSSTKWDYPDASTLALRLGAPTPQNAIEGDVDDVAVWSRVLSFAEIADLYKSGMSIKQACQLP
jgi:hypothetical protein